MKRIPLSNKDFALVDDEDYEDLIQFKWHRHQSTNNRTYYAIRRFMDNGKKRSEFMHKRITGFKQTDHKNQNGLDNTRENLRIADYSQNNANKIKTNSLTTSQYKGVCWDKKHNKWKSSIRVDNRGIHLGYFVEEKEAAKSYDLAAVKYFGEYASTNFK